MRRVAVVDASLPLRHGIAGLLRDRGLAEVVGPFDHDEALAWTGDWAQVDALIVGAVDLRRDGDQFPGPRVAATLRRHRPVGTATISVVATEPSDQRIRRRMWEADADALVGLTDLNDAATLTGMITAPADHFALRPPRLTETARLLGIERSSRINRFVERAEALGTEYLAVEAPDDAPPLRSRWWLHYRGELTEAGGLRVVNRDGTAPDRNQRVASLAQLRRVYEWATRV